jgi:hypothetical protein
MKDEIYTEAARLKIRLKQVKDLEQVLSRVDPGMICLARSKRPDAYPLSLGMQTALLKVVREEIAEIKTRINEL